MHAIDRQLLDAVESVAIKAGDIIMALYCEKTEVDSQIKDDMSPVTKADLQAHDYIVDALHSINLDIPIISEESAIPSFQQRQEWAYYWLVDPLDGTKEFISRNGEFTVNIALIVDGYPVLGVVYSPVLRCLYKAINTNTDERGAFKVELSSQFSSGSGQAPQGTVIKSIGIKERLNNVSLIKIVASRHHGVEHLAALAKRIADVFGQVEMKSIGSSLKLCLIAEGKADLYPRIGPTSEWDTAAAQAVVEAAGGAVLDSTLKPLKYNQKDSLLNPEFFVVGEPFVESGELKGDDVSISWLSTIQDFMCSAR